MKAAKRKRTKSLKVIIRDNMIHEIDSELRAKFGELYYDLSRQSIYRRIAARTGYCTKIIAYALNHTTFQDTSDFTE